MPRTLEEIRFSRDHRPRGRRARSVENRVGQAWRESVERSTIDVNGEPMSVIVNRYHRECTSCGKVIRVNDHGEAQCENPRCALIFNDTHLIIEQMNRMKASGPPPPRTHVPRVFMKACKAVSAG